MKDYTSSTPEFSEIIRILEASDPGHADNVNVTTEQLLQNTLVLKQKLEQHDVDEAAHQLILNEIARLDAELALLKLKYSTNINQNPFSVTFRDLDGVVVKGIWDAALGRIAF